MSLGTYQIIFLILLSGQHYLHAQLCLCCCCHFRHFWHAF